VNFVNLQKPREDPELFIVVSVRAFSIERSFLAFLTKDICVCVCVCVGERERESHQMKLKFLIFTKIAINVNSADGDTTNQTDFDVLLTVHFNIILGINQLKAQILV